MLENTENRESQHSPENLIELSVKNFQTLSKLHRFATIDRLSSSWKSGLRSIAERAGKDIPDLSDEQITSVLSEGYNLKPDFVPEAVKSLKEFPKMTSEEKFEYVLSAIGRDNIKNLIKDALTAVSKDTASLFDDTITALKERVAETSPTEKGFNRDDEVGDFFSKLSAIAGAVYISEGLPEEMREKIIAYYLLQNVTSLSQFNNPLCLIIQDSEQLEKLKARISEFDHILGSQHYSSESNSGIGAHFGRRGVREIREDIIDSNFSEGQWENMWHNPVVNKDLKAFNY